MNSPGWPGGERSTMDFGLAEDQNLLEQTIRSFLADRVSIQRVREFLPGGWGLPIPFSLLQAGVDGVDGAG